MQLKKALNPLFSLRSFYCSYFLPKKDAGSRAIHHPLLTMQNHEIFQKNPYSIVHFKVLHRLQSYTPILYLPGYFSIEIPSFVSFLHLRSKFYALQTAIIYLYSSLINLQKEKKLVQKTKEKMCMNDPRKDCRMNLRITVF